MLDTAWLCAGKKRDSGGVPALYLHLRHKQNSAYVLLHTTKFAYNKIYRIISPPATLCLCAFACILSIHKHNSASVLLHTAIEKSNKPHYICTCDTLPVCFCMYTKYTAKKSHKLYCIISAPATLCLVCFFILLRKVTNYTALYLQLLHPRNSAYVLLHTARKIKKLYCIMSPPATLLRKSTTKKRCRLSAPATLCAMLLC